MDVTPTGPITVRGCCHLYYALDIGFSVDLKRCAGLIEDAREDPAAHHHARTPPSLNLRPMPVSISQGMQPIQGRTFRTDDRVTIMIYDFGAVSVEYRTPFAGTFDEMAALSSELYDNRAFAVDAHARAEALLAAIRPAVQRPMVRPESEDYLVFEIPELPQGHRDLDRLLAEQGQDLARVLSSNTKALSEQQEREELSGRISYYADDLTIITWNAALICGTDMEDVRTLLELANVQLRELHFMDEQLDRSLQESYDVRARLANVKARMRRIRELMLDGQSFSETVINAFKPFPDAFLARVLALASESLGLKRFDRSIQGKLRLLNTLYSTLADEAAHERSVRLEWIVIVLIFIEIILGIADKVLPWLRGLIVGLTPMTFAPGRSAIP